MAYLLEVLQQIIVGLKATVLIFLVTISLSIPLGLIGAVLKKSKWKPIVWIMDAYTWVIRGTPLLLQLYFAVFGLPILFGLTWDRMFLALLTFVINYTAYFIEIFRGSMNSIARSQFESCKVLGLNKTQMYMHVILPQTVKKALPAITNEAITLVKDTALVAAVAILDILQITKRIVSTDIRFEAYFVAAAMYLVLSYVIVKLFKKIEKKYAYYR